MLRLLGSAMLISLLFLGCETKSLDVSPETVFENEYAKVSHVTLDPGSQQSRHFGEDRITYALNDLTIEFQQNEMDAKENQWGEGDIHFHHAGQHQSKNVGDQTANWLVFERKSNDLPSVENSYIDIEEDLSLNEKTSVLFENELFKVTKVLVEPGMEIPEHEGSHRVVYSLSNYTLEYEAEAEEDRIREFEIGDVHWHQATEHSVENVGDTSVEFLIVVYKSV